ncbi:hypothetical protein K474DRAFT_1701659 [Panus rudis PR-1116 ss-1]|nr:hypothetical protein K474DRAFT_1701659 [Panus rudis PR-1116 ss-1]
MYVPKQNHADHGRALLPPEVWLRIFGSIPKERPLGREALRSSSLTCRAFCRLAQPLLFSRVTFYIRPSYKSFRVVHLPADCESFKEKVEFVSSAAIAPHVRELIYYDHFALLESTYRDMVFRKLPLFVNLVKFETHDSTLPSDYLGVLRSLPQLRDVVLKNALFPSAQSHATGLPALKSLSLDWKYQHPEEGVRNPSEWCTSLINADSVESLVLGSDLHQLSTFEQILPPMYDQQHFPRLRSLALHYSATKLRGYADFVVACPALEELELRGFTANDIPPAGRAKKLPSNALPRLRKLTASLPFIVSYSRDRPVKEVEINTTLQPDHMPVLPGMLAAVAPDLESLSICAYVVPTSFVYAVFERFNHFRCGKFFTDFVEDDLIEKFLMSAREKTLPKALQYLHIRNHNNRRGCSSKKPMVDPSIDVELRLACPKVQAVSLQTAQDVFEWTRETALDYWQT